MCDFRVLFYNVTEQQRVDWDMELNTDDSKKLHANVLRGGKSLDKADAPQKWGDEVGVVERLLYPIDPQFSFIFSTLQMKVNCFLANAR